MTVTYSHCDRPEAEGLESGVVFEDISTVDDIWDWFEGGLLSTVFPDDEWYNGDALDDSNADESGFIFYYNKVYRES